MIEQIAGERFTSVEPTPLLQRCIEAARQALAAALGKEAEVVVGAQLELGPDTTLRPSIAVYATQPAGGNGAIPDLVVEFRTESTGRFILGPKRLAYARSHVDELWYVDPTTERIAVLRSDCGRDYGWPPAVYRLDEEIQLARFPEARATLSCVIPLVADRARQAGELEQNVWLAV